jgi:hypothetical protein
MTRVSSCKNWNLKLHATSKYDCLCWTCWLVLTMVSFLNVLENQLPKLTWKAVGSSVVWIKTKVSNGTAQIRHLCSKITIFSCHRCLILCGVEEINNTILNYCLNFKFLTTRFHEVNCNFLNSDKCLYFKSPVPFKTNFFS